MDTESSGVTMRLPQNPVIVEATIKHMQHTIVHYLSGYEREMQAAITEEVGRAFASFDIRGEVQREVRKQFPELLRRVVERAVTSALWSKEASGIIEKLALSAITDLQNQDQL